MAKEKKAEEKVVENITEETVEKAIDDLNTNLKTWFEKLYGECTENDGVYRSVLSNLGVTRGQVIIEAVLEDGFREDYPYGVLHFHTTVAQNIPEEALADLLISLNTLNHVINTGVYPGFGCFCYYEPLSQVYLSYRMPVNLFNVEAEYDNILYYLSCLYEQLDMFMDFLAFMISFPGSMTIDDYMEYLDQVANLDDLEERMNAFVQAFDEYISEIDIEPGDEEDTSDDDAEDESDS
ncbi:MAG: hypothetical protein K6G03_12365 [Lachnospiraceae bacterium]|nr:hypothetical protein [Lachnospiraceae bacterium]